MSDLLADYIIVGSGLCGVQAAQTLAEAGCNLVLLDVGEEAASGYHNDLSFMATRQQDEEQYKYWLGEDLSGLPGNAIAAGSQLTPSRKHVVRRSSLLTPFLSDNFFPMESLAKGGLGGAWGLGCCAFSDAELDRSGLPIAAMREAYSLIAGRIGISYSPDDIEEYVMPGINNLQPGIRIDSNSESLIQKYEKKKKKINKAGFYLGKSSLALLTREKDGRKPCDYREMDFYTTDEAAYRPAITLEHLQSFSNFRYLRDHLVTHFEEINAIVRIYFINTRSNVPGYYECNKLLLACNVLGTTRIVLRSQQQFNTRLPVLCNPYTYMPCLQWKMLGKIDQEPRTATAQLFLVHDPDKTNADVAMASLYSYRSLLMFRVLNQSPLNAKDARILLQYLLPALTIAGIHHPDEFTDSKYIWIEKDPASFNNIILKATTSFSPDRLDQIARREKLFMKFFRQMGCRPLKKVNPGYGASIHYAGTLPYSKEEKPLRLLPDGRLGLMKNIYVADGSGFTYLPAKGISFSLMANAHRTALNSIAHE